MKVLFQTDSTPQLKFAKIDDKSGVIYGVKMCTLGEAKGHGMWLDSTFIDSVVTLAQRHKNGLRARFGHPNMCSDSLGTYLGVYKNIRREEDSAVGDLFLSDVAKNTPNGNLFDYVLNLSKKDPGAFGSSIVFEGPEPTETFKTEDGKELGLATISTLEFCDLVGQPAATDGLFSADSLAENVTNFLDTNPRIFDLIEKKPEILENFLTKYKFYKQKQSNMFNFKKKEKQKICSAQFSDGTKVVFSGDLEEGTELTPVDSELETLPDGDYTIDDGRKITVVDGIVKTVSPAEPEEESPMMSDEQLSAVITAVSKAFSEQLKGLESKFEALQAEFTALKGKSSTATPPKGKEVSPVKPETFSAQATVEAITNKVREKLNQSRKA